MKHLSITIAAAIVITAAPAAAQLTFDGPKFVEAVRDRDNNTALDLLRSQPVVVNARDGRGDTALLVAIARKDDAWTATLLRAGADPNLAARNGDTPLIVAARSGFDEGVEWLLSLGVKVDDSNRMGETPLIVAVQGRHLPVVRMLLRAGANPDKTDSAAGLSARDYAKRDTRSTVLLKLIEDSEKTAATAGR